MLFAFLTYLYFTFESLVSTTSKLAFVYILIMAVFSFFMVMHYIYDIADKNHEEERWKKETKEDSINLYKFFKHSYLNKIWYPKTLVFIIVLAALFPSQNTLKWVAGAYVTSESISYLSSNEAAKKLPNNVLEAANTFLEELSVSTVKEVTESVKTETVTIKDELVSEVKELTQEQKQILIEKLQE